MNREGGKIQQAQRADRAEQVAVKERQRADELEAKLQTAQAQLLPDSQAA